MKKVLLIILIAIIGNASDAQKLSAPEQELYDIIMKYRKSRRLPTIPLSESLTYVAQVHARDLVENNPVHGECNLHSWSDKGPWSECCSEHHACMMNIGIWRQPWNAIGIGIYQGYALVWFGHEEDSTGNKRFRN